MSRRSATLAGAVVALGAAAAVAVDHWRTRNIGPVQRGWALAAARGCFGCHGPGGVTGAPDPGGGVGGVPSFSSEDVSSYAHDEAELREWILDGMPRRLREDLGEAGLAKRPLLRMPAWRGVLSAREVDDLVAFVKAASDFERPDDPRAEAGREASARMGCFGCHGPQGRGNLPNPRSLKGYVPSWDGADYPDLVRDEAELREWILDGSPRRLRENPLAAFFLRRQVLQMPAYRGKISEEDVGRIVEYISWLRANASAGSTPRTATLP
jgi:mono/diheme cytochrome c family protein